jgi:hypothetical protein
MYIMYIVRDIVSPTINTHEEIIFNTDTTDHE